MVWAQSTCCATYKRLHTFLRCRANTVSSFQRVWSPHSGYLQPHVAIGIVSLALDNLYMYMYRFSVSVYLHDADFIVSAVERYMSCILLSIQIAILLCILQFLLQVQNAKKLSLV